MNIIYILTSLALIISYLLLNKSEKKENLIHSVIISVILFLTYNIFITQVMFFVHLKSTLLNLAIVNIAFSAVFITKDGHIYITEGIEDDITLLDDFSNISPNIIKNEN